MSWRKFFPSRRPIGGPAFVAKSGKRHGALKHDSRNTVPIPLLQPRGDFSDCREQTCHLAGIALGPLGWLRARVRRRRLAARAVAPVDSRGGFARHFVAAL